jgi:hypothetical protein
LLEPGQVADEEDDVAGVDVGADGPVGFACVEERRQRLADRAETVRGEVLRYARLDAPCCTASPPRSPCSGGKVTATW